MLLDIKQFINGLTSFRELKQQTYPNEIKIIKELTKFLPEKAGMSQRCWHIVNDKLYIQKCINCDTPTKWWPQYKKYREFCSHVCVNKSNVVKERRQETCFKNNGVYVPAKSEHIRNKMKETLIDHYGVESPLQSDILKNKAILTWNKNIGRSHPSYKHISNITLNKLNNYEWLYTQYIDNNLSLLEISKLLENIDASAISRHLKRFNIPIRYDHTTSIAEKQIVTFIKQSKINVIENTKDIITPGELDIYIPDQKIAIEYNGLYWHSEQTGRDKWYHYNKWKSCKDNNVQLIQIFEDEWLHRNQQVKQKLLSLLGKDNRKKIFARKCHIVNVSTKMKQQFFEDNHIQGDGPSSINIGLEYNGTLIACMGFIKQKNQHYLNRYATSARVIGGFSKLLKYFQNNYQWNKLISFADLRWSDGNLYRKTGWKLDSILPPDYTYTKMGTTKRIHKFNYRRKNLPKLLQNFDPNLSERQNCDMHNLLRIWDCGKFRFILER